MTVRAFLTFVAALPFALGSCSLVSTDGDPLEAVWAVAGAADVLPSTIGSADEGHFYAMRGSRGQRTLTAHRRDDGSTAWSRSLLAYCNPPIVGDGRVYCASDELVAHDASNGAVVWTFGAPSPLSLVDGTTDGERVYVGIAGAPTGAGRIFAVDAATGGLVWDRAFDGPGWEGNWMQALTLSPEGDLLVAFTAEFDPPRIFSAAVVAAVDPATGAERWRFVDGDATTDRDIGELTLWRDLVLYSDLSGGEAVAFSRATREVVWRAPFTPGSFSTRRPPMVADGVAYFTDTLGGVFAVDAATGAERWTTERPYGFLSHAVCGDVVFGNDQIGAVLDRRTGRYLGDLFPDRSSVPGQVAVADGVLYVSASDGVHAFDCAL